MNTTADPIEQSNLMTLLRRVEPAWKLNSIRPDPANRIFEQRAPPRRAFLDWNQSMVGSMGGGGTGSGNQTPPSFRAVMAVDTGGDTFTSVTVTVYGIPD